MQMNGRASWLVTGVAGFIGSHILEKLLLLDQKVVGIDNFSTGKTSNLDEVRRNVPDESWKNFQLVEGDITSESLCEDCCKGIDYVLHHAAIASVTDSFANPNRTNDVNVKGFVNVFLGAKKSGVNRFVYASSSAVYGNSGLGSLGENSPLDPLSPYALSKHVNECHAKILRGNEDMVSIGLRYFNVYGPRQSVDGPYSAVIPLWAAAAIKGEPIQVFGDGSTTRDFCYIGDVVQANILAATADLVGQHHVFNVGSGHETSLNQLHAAIHHSLGVDVANRRVEYRSFREGEVRHSKASVNLIESTMGFRSETSLGDGLKATVDWHLSCGKA
jgi:UDP-N-acetylglucosamine 4-epimerase